MTRTLTILLGALALFTLAGCAANADPLETDVVVATAGTGAPVQAGTQCVLRMQPAWRQGVNCQILLRCTTSHGEEDLFGGRRIGGYSVCETEDGHFTSALDDNPRDGDPALQVDLEEGTLTWRGPRKGQEATLRVATPTRVAQAW